MTHHCAPATRALRDVTVLAGLAGALALAHGQQAPSYNFRDALKARPSPDIRPLESTMLGKPDLLRGATSPASTDTERLLQERIALLEKKIEILEARLALAERKR